jgi:hypothetical protein
MGPLNRLLNDRRGAIATVMAIATPALIGGMGLSVDTIQWTLSKRQLQRQADSGAIAGAYSLAQGAPVQAAVFNDLARNPVLGDAEGPIIQNAPTAGPSAGDARAVRVVLRTNMDLPFSRVFLDAPVRIRAEATAAAVANGNYCALSLETRDRTGIEMGGNSTVDLNCGMATNSPSNNAVSAFGSSTVIASPISAVGYVAPSSNYSTGTKLISYSVAQPDPFAHLANPVPTGPNRTVTGANNQTLNPGVYKNGMDLKRNVTLNPGVYYVDGGELKIGSQANVQGTGVTIILTSATAGSNPNSIATVSINGGAKVNLKATTSGTYAGVLFYQDRRAVDSNQANKINGNSSSAYQGAFYFPKQELEFTGNSGMEIDCIQMVALRLDFSGNSRVRNICPVGSGAQAFIGTAVRLVG